MVVAKTETSKAKDWDPKTKTRKLNEDSFRKLASRFMASRKKASFKKGRSTTVSLETYPFIHLKKADNLSVRNGDHLSVEQKRNCR